MLDWGRFINILPQVLTPLLSSLSISFTSVYISPSIDCHNTKVLFNYFYTGRDE
ncbi:Uncharacterised protein [Yersinia frederiksenii]|nr:Uncharacterised protein [Yersinia frederiksenii]